MTYGPIKLTGDASAFGYGSDISVEITGLGSKPLPTLEHGYLKYDETLQSWITEILPYEAQYVSNLPLTNTTTNTVQLSLENLDNRIQQYAGVSTFPSFVDNGNGSVTVGQGTYNLYSSLTGETLLKQYTIAGDTFTLTDGLISYIYVDYNSGSPALLVTTDRNVLADAMLCTKTVVFTIFRQGTTIRKIPWGLSAIGAAEKLVDKSIDTVRFQRGGYSGLELTNTNLVFSVAAGKVWYGVNRLTLDTFTSNVNTTLQHVFNGTSWSTTPVTQLNNTQYQGPTGLVTLDNNKYTVNWIFRSISNPDTCGIVLGTASYSLLEAESAKMPPLPDYIERLGMYIGRVIIGKNSTTPSVINSAFDTAYTSAMQIIKHGDLQGRDDIDQHPISAITFTDTNDTVMVGISSIDHLTTLNLGADTADTINLGTATSTQTVNIGTGSGITTVNVGAHGDTINIGVGVSPDSTTINLGSSGDTVNIAGTLTYVNTTNLEVVDKNITINKGGAAASAGNSGISVEENSTLTGSLTINANRDSWVLKAPLNPGTISLKPSTASYDASINPTVLTANRTYTLPDKTGTVALTSDIGTFTSAVQTTTSNTISAVTNIDSFAANIYRTAEYLISITYGTSYHATKILVVHDGTTAYLTEYGTVLTGTSLATFDAAIETGNLVLKATPTNSNTTIKIFRTSIAV